MSDVNDLWAVIKERRIVVEVRVIDVTVSNVAPGREETWSQELIVTRATDPLVAVKAAEIVARAIERAAS